MLCFVSILCVGDLLPPIDDANDLCLQRYVMIFESVQLILLLMNLILVVCDFSKNIRVVNASLLFMTFWLFVSTLLDLRGHESADPLWA
jgi:hypothetical protein